MANGGRSGSDESGALEALSEVECNWPQNNTKGTLQKMYFLDIKKHKGTLGYQHFAKSGRILEKG